MTRLPPPLLPAVPRKLHLLALGLALSLTIAPTQPSQARGAAGNHEASAQTHSRRTKAITSARRDSRHQAPRLGVIGLESRTPEARLIEVYKLISAQRLDDALKQVKQLVDDVPTFQLAQLTYGDLLLARSGQLFGFGAVPDQLAADGGERLAQLRDEAVQRIQALTERPETGTIPRQFVELPASMQHAIAVDASRSRLYLFETSSRGLRLVSDHYVSLGRLGVDKAVVGDQRTPLGVYFITNRLNGKQLTDFYGTGALQLNYPNEYDRRLGKTGSGIWLHGVPSDSFSRSPHSTDGCVALANSDLRDLLDKVRPRATPVLIAPHLNWVKPADLSPNREQLRSIFERWREARTQGDLDLALSFYSARFSNGQQDRSDWRRVMQRDVQNLRGRRTQIKDLSILTWQDKTDLMVVTFGEVPSGERTGPVRRQYWSKEGQTWKIFYEGVIG